MENYRVTNLDTRLYIASKIEALKRQIVGLEAALSVLEEADEVLSAIQPVVRVGVDLAAGEDYTAKTTYEGGEIVGIEISKDGVVVDREPEQTTMELFPKDQSLPTEMTVDQFYANIKLIKSKSWRTRQDIMNFCSLNSSGMHYIFKDGRKATRNRLLLIAKCFSITITNIDDHYKNSVFAQYMPTVKIVGTVKREKGSITGKPVIKAIKRTDNINLTTGKRKYTRRDQAPVSGKESA